MINLPPGFRIISEDKLLRLRALVADLKQAVEVRCQLCRRWAPAGAPCDLGAACPVTDLLRESIPE